MDRISRYLIAQCAAPLGFALGVLTAIVWLTQSLQRIDIIVERGQTAGVFFKISLLILPSLLTVIIPFALLAAVLYGLHKLRGDSELVILSAAGVSRLRMAGPILVLSMIAAGAVLFLNLWLAPLSYRAMKTEVAHIRADVVGSLLRGGEFLSPVSDLTFYARETLPGGQFRGLMVYDRRKEERPVAYLAESALMRETLSGPQLLMATGTIQRRKPGDDAVSILNFDQYALDISQFAKAGAAFQLELTERYLSELLHPDPESRWDRDNHGRLIAEGHNRLASPLYAVAYGLLALVAVAGGPRRRGGGWGPLWAVIAALGLRICGFLTQSAAASSPMWNAGQYAVPLTAALACYAILAWGRHPASGRSAPALAPAPPSQAA
ncbi:MAG: LptF/LptG family permease [Pseudomonadota bacterium]